MQNIRISFYVLSESKAQDFLGFVCQLTQTVLTKSRESLLILSEDEALLHELDAALWTYESTSFIPHTLLSNAHLANESAALDYKAAPVSLATYIPTSFKGIVVNTTAHPITDLISGTSTAVPTRILEIIKPEASSVDEGRLKYKRYQALGYELTHFKV